MEPGFCRLVRLGGLVRSYCIENGEKLETAHAAATQPVLVPKIRFDSLQPFYQSIRIR
jgi:hypothetical protein